MSGNRVWSSYRMDDDVTVFAMEQYETHRLIAGNLPAPAKTLQVPRGVEMRYLSYREKGRGRTRRITLGTRVPIGVPPTQIVETIDGVPVTFKLLGIVKETARRSPP